MRPQVVLGVAATGLTTALSYTLQRLGGAAQGELPYEAVIATAHIPFYWRFDMALLHGLSVGLLVAFGLPEAPARSVLDRGHWLTLAVVLPCVVAMLLVP